MPRQPCVAGSSTGALTRNEVSFRLRRVGRSAAAAVQPVRAPGGRGRDGCAEGHRRSAGRLVPAFPSAGEASGTATQALAVAPWPVRVKGRP